MPALIPKTNSITGSPTPPTAAVLATGELAENKYIGRTFMKTESGNVVDTARVTLTGDVVGTTATATSEGNAGTIPCVLATIGVTKGGTGVTATPANGQILIGNGSGYTLSTITAGSNVTITNAAGAITINSTGGGSSSTGGGGIKIFDTAGPNQSWTVPAGVTNVKITVIGGGAGSTNGGVSTCSVGGVTVTAGGGITATPNPGNPVSGGAGGSVAAVPAVGLGGGTGGATNANGTGSNGGYGGGGGGYGEAVISCTPYWVYAAGGCGIGGGGGGLPLIAGNQNFILTYGFGGPGAGYGGAGESRGFGAGSSVNNTCSGGGGGYATYSIAVTPGATYSNAITVGAAGTGASRGAVIIEW